MSRVRWGLLSTANINRRVIPAIRASRRGELVAVASRDLDRAQAYAQKWDIAQTFGSYDAMLQSGAVDAVYISLPNHLHAEWTLRAMDRGVHVLCEKPFALTLQEVDEIIAARERTGAVVAEAFMYRHHPQTKIVGEWVRAGRLGDVRAVRGVFSFPIASPENIRLVPDWGGGSLWDIGVYPLSFAQYVMGGPPQRVLGEQWIGASGVDEFFTGQLHYEGDRVAQIVSSFRTTFQTHVEIIGSEGRLELTRPFIFLEEGKLLFHPVDGDVVPIDVPQKHLYLGEIEDMHAAILDGELNYLTLAETRDHVRTALALYESARVGQIVTL